MALDIQFLLRAIDRASDCVETIPDTRRAPSSVQGTGLFTLRARRAGELLCVLDGQRLHLDHFPEALELEWNALSDRELLVRPFRTSYGYINHAAAPNLTIEADGVRLVAARDIPAGEELTLDYFAAPVPPEFLASQEAKSLTLASLSSDGQPP
jgi:hypothetical protein